MSTESPKLRSDLLFSRQDCGSQVVFVVKDPLHNQFFRLNETDHFIAAQLDGQTPLETIRRRVEEKFNVSLSQPSLAHFVASLRKSKLLESGDAQRQRRARRGRLRGSPLYLRFKLLDPDALLQQLVRRVRFCFTPAFVAGSATAIVWAILLAAANWNGLRQDLIGLMRWEAVIGLVTAMFAVSTAHEFAHSLTCKHFGGEVRELGFLLVYLQPALYCNVSDAWLFPDKRRRLWVGFAGPYFEMFLWACAVLLWRVTDPETWLNFAALAVIATSGLKTLLNLNPLLKLDGYYLLCDLLDIPNLRRRAFKYIGQGMRRLAGFGETKPAELPRREKRIYLGYGLAATVVSFSVLGFAVAKLGGYFIANRQPEALIVAVSLLGIKARRRIGRFFGKSSDPSDSDDLSITQPAPEPNGVAAESQPKRRRHKLRPFPRRLVRAALVLAVGLPLLFFVPMGLRVTGSFTALPIQNADVRAEIAGTIEEVFVDEGDWVHAGEAIARLSDRDNRTAWLKAEADLEQMQAQLRLLQAGPRREEIELARLSVRRAEERSGFARKNLERDQELFQDQLISRREFEASKQAVADSESEISEAKQRLQLLLAGSRPEEIEAARAGISRLETQRRYLEEQLAHVKVSSPATGMVATPSRQLKELIGQVVKEGDLIAKVHEMKTLEVQTPVSEKDIADIKVGDPVALKARAFPEKTFFGTVTSVGATAQIGRPAATVGTSAVGTTSTSLTASGSTSTTPTVLVTTRIANDDLLLKPGMSGMVKIHCGDRRLFDLLARRVARTVKVEFWSWW